MRSARFVGSPAHVVTVPLAKGRSEMARPPRKRAGEPHGEDASCSAMSSWPSDGEQAVEEAFAEITAGGSPQEVAPREGMTSGALDEISGERLSAADVQRATRGARALLRGADGKAYQMLVTYREPGKRKRFGGYQITCYHHAATQVQRAGKCTSYRAGRNCQSRRRAATKTFS